MGIDLRDKNLSILDEGVDVSSSASSINFAGSGVSVASVGDDITVTIPGGGGVTSVSGTAPIVSSGGATPAISIPVATNTINGYLSSTDWATFKAKQDTITLTTTGSSGAATLVGATLNIPNYAGGGSGLTIGTTPITSGVVGRVLFEGAGNVAQEDATFFWDNTNKRLGVGATPSTSTRLDVRAQGALSTDIVFRARNSADTTNLFEIRGDGNQAWLSPGNSALNSIKSGTYNFIQWGNENYGNIAIGYNTANLITPSITFSTLLGSNTSILAGNATRVGSSGTIGIGGDYAIGIGQGINVKGNSTIHIGRRTGTSSFSGLNSIHLGKTPSGNDISPSNVFMTHFDSEYASTLSRGNGSFGLLGQTAYILGDGTGTYGVDKFMGNGGNTLVIANHASVPSTNIANAGQIYVEGGALKYRGSNGTITVLGAA